MKEQTVKELTHAGISFSTLVVGQKGGYGISIKYGSIESVLETSRGEPRLFTLETAMKFLRQFGIYRFEVDVSNYESGRIRKPRPDRAAALRKTRTSPHQETLI